MITHVAIRKANGAVYAIPKPARHCHFMAGYNEASRKEGWDCPWPGWPDSEGLFDEGSEQGFCDENGVFLDRKQAAAHAIECGQPLREKIRGELFSENVW